MLGLGERQLADHDRATLRDHAGNHPEAGGDARIEKASRGAGDQRRIEVVGGAVEIEAGARDPGRNQRSPVVGNVGVELLDKGVLGGAQLQGR